MIQLSKHADSRCQMRGIKSILIQAIIENADVEADMGGGCRLLRVRHRTAAGLGISERLHRVAVIWSENRGQVVTVLPLHAGRSGRRYRKIL